MRRKSFIIVLGVLMVLGVTINAFASNNSSQKAIKASVKFNNPVDVESVEKLTNDFGIKIEGFENISNVAERQYIGFYLVNKNASLHDAIKDYKEQYYSAMVDGMEVLEERIKTIQDDKLKESAQLILSDLKKRKEDFEQNQSIKIKSLIISGEESELNKFGKQYESQISLYIKGGK